MRVGRWILTAGVLISGMVLIWGSTAMSREIPRISKEEAVKMLGDPHVVIIDVRQGLDWMLSKEKIKGAVKENPGDIVTWMNKYPKEKILIFY